MPFLILQKDGIGEVSTDLVPTIIDGYPELFLNEGDPFTVTAVETSKRHRFEKWIFTIGTEVSVDIRNPSENFGVATDITIQGVFMEIPVWPNIVGPSLPVQEEPTDPSIRTRSESGFVMTRSRGTRITKTWKLTWPGMSNDDHRLLDEFYARMMGGSTAFYWPNPATDQEVLVRFAEKITSEIVTWDSDGKPGLWSVRATVEEV